MKLDYISYDELIFTLAPGSDRINTYLELKDYSWMHYVLKTEFHTINQGVLYIDFIYNGSTYMKVEQHIDQEINHYEYPFEYDLFKTYIKVFLIEHFESWESKYAFNGGNIVLGFYNSVLASYHNKNQTYH